MDVLKANLTLKSKVKVTRLKLVRDPYVINTWSKFEDIIQKQCKSSHVHKESQQWRRGRRKQKQYVSPELGGGEENRYILNAMDLA